MSVSYKSFKVIISKKSIKWIKFQSKAVQLQILEKLKTLVSDNFDSLDTKKLRGYDNLFRIRCGVYRIVYRPNNENKIIKVVVEHRRNIYNLIQNQTWS